jgi:O-antigen/teichoic acid export membrane protein
VIAWILKGHLFAFGWRLSWNRIRSYAKEFYQYSSPLFLYALVGLIVVFLDRWLLQVFGGGVQQGFYGLSYQIGAVCFLFTSSIVSLIMREFSIAYTNKDLMQMAFLFRRYIPLFYGIVAYFSCFIAMQAESVAYIFGGAGFHGAAMAIAIMAFYQIHQTYGMLSGAVFMASGQTQLYSKIGIIFMLVGIPISYFLIAPENKMGLNAGATGLAIKMVIVQFLGVNVHLYFNCRFLKLNFWRYMGHQVLSVFILLVFSAFASLVVDNLSILQNKIIVRFLLSGMLYSTMVMGLLYYMPLLFGLERKDISSVLRSLANNISFRPGD